MAQIDIKKSFLFPISTVFEAFLASSSAQNFMFRTEAGQLVSADLTPELGGEFTIVEKRGDTEVGHYGSFVELEPLEKISFVYSTEKDSTESSYVELFFSKSASGCQIQLVQELAPENENATERIKAAWSEMFQKLEKHLNKSDVSTTTSAITKDSQGQILSEGDAVKTIKDLKVKGSSMVVKRGTVVKNIRLLPDSPAEIDCKVDGVGLHLETQWLLKM